MIKKVIFTEVILALVAFFLNLFISSDGNLLVNTSNTFYMGAAFLGANLLMFLYFFLSWNYSYYIVTPTGVSFTSGLIFRKNKSIDIVGIRSVAVNQGLLGKILNYGTIILESPVLTDQFVLSNVPNAFGHAELINNTRLKAIKKLGGDNIIYTS